MFLSIEPVGFGIQLDCHVGKRDARRLVDGVAGQSPALGRAKPKS